MTGKPPTLHLLPTPRHVRWLDGDAPADAPIQQRRDTALPPEGYSLKITPTAISIATADDAGVFYASQTLDQIRAQAPVPGRIPCVEIDDHPHFARRGYYLDISRGRVPRMDRLKRKIRLLAHLKINHLQLYFEHPFRFAFNPEIAGDGDALGADDLRDLDVFCRSLHIELTPSFTCFGHLGRILSLPAYRRLAEVEFPAATWEEATWLQRMRGATLNSTLPDAQDLVTRILDEFLPCFSSTRFNLCGDETYDIGRHNPTASADDIAGQYAAHLRFLHETAGTHGKTLMLWGDMLLQYPGILKHLPPDCDILDWAYFPSNHFDKCRTFAEAGLPFTVCPSVRGFGMLFNAVEEARQVLRRYADAGKAYGAAGFLNTDWGDYGHFNMPPCALHGLALGAQLAWNPGNDSGGDFDAAFSQILFNQSDTQPAALFSAAGSIPADIAAWPFAPIKNLPVTTPPEECAAIARQTPDWADGFQHLKPTPWVDETDLAQLQLACRFIGYAAQTAGGCPTADTLPLLDELEKDYIPLWFEESQPRGLLDIHSRGFMPMRHLNAAD